MTSDAELLQDFARERSQAAFAELVRRHLDLVYSAALRQVGGDAHLAGDVAQRVFLDLAGKAGALPAAVSLPGWLYQAAHYAAANVMRAERRRKKYEQEAQAMLDQNRSDEADWAQVRPVLDEAMLDLGETDREAVLRRFFSAQSFGEIGAALGLSEDGARRRVERALDKLHGLLARRGITSGAAALGIVLTQHAVRAAPAELHRALASSAAGAGAPTATAAAGLSFYLMNKITAGIAAAAALALMVSLVGQSRTRVELRADLEALAVREAAAEQMRVRADREVAAARIASPTVTPPAAEDDLVVTGNQRAGLDASYAPLFRQLRLRGDRLDRLKDLLVRRDRKGREATAWLKAAGAAEVTLNWKESFQLKAVVTQGIEQEIRALLGDGVFEYYMAFERTLAVRQMLRPFVQTLAGTTEEVRDDQVDQLAQLLDAEMDYDVLPYIPVNALERAKAVLTPHQWEKFKLAQGGLEALKKMGAMTRAAAERGKLSEAHAREYAEWKAKAAASPTR